MTDEMNGRILATVPTLRRFKSIIKMLIRSVVGAKKAEKK